MCALPLEAVESRVGVRADLPLSDQIPAPVLVSGPEPNHQHAPASSFAGHLVCQNCKAVNEPDYIFCEQCGSRLTRPVPVTAERPGVDTTPPPQAKPAQPARSESGPRIQPSEAPRQAPLPDWLARSERNRTRDPVESDDDQNPSTKGAYKEASRKPGAKASPPLPKEKVSCDHCGNTQPTGGLYCGICGSVLTPKPGQKAAPILELITDNTSERETYQVKGEVVLGRIEGDVTFSHDGYMSGRHARIVERDGRYFLSDEGSRNGTFVRIDEEVEIKDGDVFLIGKQVLKFIKPS
jgi:hypothetical protein